MSVENGTIFFCSGKEEARTALQRLGARVCDHPSPDVTHLLLGVPEKRSDEELTRILETLPESVTVLGGWLNRDCLKGYRTLDLLTDERYLAENARITAHCALEYAARRLEYTLGSMHILVIGWGRIGKHLVHLLEHADVTVCARKEADRAMLESMGIPTLAPGELAGAVQEFTLIFNTAPEPVADVTACKGLKIDLASQPGLLGEAILHARGLPGTMAAKEAGELAARTAIRLAGGGNQESGFVQ